MGLDQAREKVTFIAVKKSEGEKSCFRSLVEKKLLYKRPKLKKLCFSFDL
jgi:hypothetical protein